jgi:hypothetical protein
LETVIGWPATGATGLFFHAQTLESLVGAVNLEEVHEAQFAPEACRRTPSVSDGDAFGESSRHPYRIFGESSNAEIS